MFTFDAGPWGNYIPVPAFSTSPVEDVISNAALRCRRSLLLFPCKNHSLKYSGLTKQQRHSLYQVYCSKNIFIIEFLSLARSLRRHGFRLKVSFIRHIVYLRDKKTGQTARIIEEKDRPVLWTVQMLYSWISVSLRYIKLQYEVYKFVFSTAMTSLYIYIYIYIYIHTLFSEVHPLIMLSRFYI